MSKVGNCARTLSAIRLGKIKDGEAPEYLKLASREGQRHEDWVRADLPEHGWKASPQVYCQPCDRYGTHVVIDDPDDGFILVGHLDGEAINLESGEIRTLEIKAPGKYVFEMYKRQGLDFSRTYRYQATCYMEANNHPMLYVVKSRDSGYILIKKMDELPYMAEITNRLTEIEEYVAKGELAPCDAETTYDKYSCTDLCYEPPTILPQDIETHLVKAIKDYRLAKVIGETASKLEDEAKKIFIASLNTLEQKNIDLDDMNIVQVPEGKRPTYEDIPDVIKEQYKRMVPRKSYIRVTDRKEI